jgi:hypothetical protein
MEKQVVQNRRPLLERDRQRGLVACVPLPSLNRGLAIFTKPLFDIQYGIIDGMRMRPQPPPFCSPLSSSAVNHTLEPSHSLLLTFTT